MEIATNFKNLAEKDRICIHRSHLFVRVSLNSAQGRESTVHVLTRGYALYQVRPAPWLGNPAAVWNMHSKLSFQRWLRNASPSVLAFYSMNMRCGCAPVFARTPTYFHGNPEHARARGTNSRENAWWIVREAKLWKISV